MFPTLDLQFPDESAKIKDVQIHSEKKKYNGSWVNLKGDGQLVTKTGNGEQMLGMVPGEWLPSTHPATTSVRCDQPVSDRCVVFGFVTRWKEDFVSMINRNFMRLLMMGTFSRVCSGVLWGMRESAVSDSGRRHWFFFGWVVSGVGREGAAAHGVRVMFTACHVLKQSKFMYLCSVLCLTLCKQSL
jgi:hypothetical protein